MNAFRSLCWIEHPPVGRDDSRLYRFTHRASAERMGNDPVAAERGHGEGVANEHAAHAFDHRLDLLLRSHALRCVAVTRPVDDEHGPVWVHDGTMMALMASLGPLENLLDAENRDRLPDAEGRYLISCSLPSP